jgi:endoglucanase
MVSRFATFEKENSMSKKGLFAFVAVLMLCLTLSALSFSSEKFSLRVNAGSSATYTDRAGNLWQGGKYYRQGEGFGFIGGDTVDRGDIPIKETEDARIYQTEHYSMTGFKADVPDGHYTVKLHFAETYSDINYDGPRVFDVEIQGREALAEFDVAKEAGAVQKPVIKEFKEIQVTDGVLSINFKARQQNPEINGIEIVAE